MSDSSASWELPATWAWAHMSEVSDVLGGGTPSTSDATNFGDDFPWITPADLSGHREKTILRGQRSLSHKGLAESSAVALPANAVLFSSRAPIGYVAIAAQPLATNQGFKSFVLRPGLVPDYVYYWLQRAKPIAVSMASGTTFLEISAKKCAQLPIPVAPPAEQVRIVAKIEELFSDLDAGVAALERVRANLKRYRAAVLKAAVEGRLTEEWRSLHPATEPAAKLLERILAERRAKWEQNQLRKFKEAGKLPPKGWKGKYERPEAAVGTSRDIPTGWSPATIGQVSWLDVGFAFKSDKFTNEGVRLLRGENIEPGALRWKETRCWPTDQVAEFEHLMVREGDIILAMDRPIVSAGLKVCRAKAHDLPCLLVQRVARFRPIDTKFTAFLYLAVQTRNFIRHVLAGQTGTQLPHISGQGIASFSFALPPLAEQAEIVAEVDRRLSVADAAETQVEHALQRATRLRQAILKRAFEGKLVPQDPTDEPAAALLERVNPASNGKHPAPAKPPMRRSRARV